MVEWTILSNDTMTKYITNVNEWDLLNLLTVYSRDVGALVVKLNTSYESDYQ